MNRKLIGAIIILAIAAVSLLGIVLPEELFVMERTFAATGRFIGFTFRFLIIGAALLIAGILAWHFYNYYQEDKEDQEKRKIVKEKYA